MKKVIAVFKKEIMLSVSLVAAIASLFLTPPSMELIKNIDWKTLAILFMMLTVLEGFKKENIFQPLIKLTGKISSMTALTFFLVGCVFVSSMFVTNDVSLIVFVPLTILLFRAGGKEKYILPVLTFENIAAIRGSLLTPFGSPQNLFLFSRSGMSAGDFIKTMFPLWVMSAALLSVFICFLFRKNIHEKADYKTDSLTADRDKKYRYKRIIYYILFILVVWVIVSRTAYWYIAAAVVLAAVLISDRETLLRTDYVLLLTFLCFFVFSSSISANPVISAFLNKYVAGHEYLSAILLSQVISNVPASIVLFPFSTNIKALLYGADSAGLCSLIGSLASVINYRIYVREYPGNGMKFIKVFTLISLAFFAFVAVPGYFLSV